MHNSIKRYRTRESAIEVTQRWEIKVTREREREKGCLIRREGARLASRVISVFRRRRRAKVTRPNVVLERRKDFLLSLPLTFPVRTRVTLDPAKLASNILYRRRTVVYPRFATTSHDLSAVQKAPLIDGGRLKTRLQRSLYADYIIVLGDAACLCPLRHVSPLSSTTKGPTYQLRPKCWVGKIVHPDPASTLTRQRRRTRGNAAKSLLRITTRNSCTQQQVDAILQNTRNV